VALGLALVTAPGSAAVVLQPVTSIPAPVFVTHAGDHRLFIVGLAGQIRIFDRDSQTLLPIPFLDISAKVSTGGERGLASMAFHGAELLQHRRLPRRDTRLQQPLADTAHPHLRPRRR
jgi:hypothetical protein